MSRLGNVGPISPDRRADINRRLEKVLNAVMGRRETTHAIISVERVDESFEWTGVAGDAGPGYTPVQAGTPYHIGGIDKFYNAVIAVLLTERGQLDLDEPISAHLGEAVTRGLNSRDGVDHGDRITPRHLLTHSSGVADWLEDSPRGGMSVLESALSHGDRTVTREEMLALVRERLAPRFVPQDAFAPRRIRYSNTNSVLLAMILESVTGRKLPEIHRELLLEPLGLRRTFFSGVTEPRDPLPEPATWHFRGELLSLPQLHRSMGSICSTAGDTIRFIRAVVTGTVFDEPETAAVLTRRWNRFPFPLDRSAMRQPAWPIEYGQGVMRFQLRRILTPRGMMPGVVGHTGSSGSWLFWCPERDLLLAGSVNELTANALPFSTVVPGILRISAFK